MTLDATKISTLVREQFPAFYLDEGQNFIQFMKGYYEWMEQPGGFLDRTYNFMSYLDIDTTIDQYIDHFKQTYMVGLPKTILGDPRFLEKHILDMYRSKGSPESVRLLFRLLYNEDIDIYVPAKDMLRVEDGKWYQKKYLEINKVGDLTRFQDKEIIGFNSGARAYVGTYEQRIMESKIIHILVIENIRGQFEVGEPVYFDGLPPAFAPRIKGSVTNVSIVTSMQDFEIGQRLTATDIDRGTVIKVTDLRSISTGIIEAELVNGGNGYTIDADVVVTGGGNTTGDGASFAIGSIVDVSTLHLSNTVINDFLTVQINDADYGFREFTTDITTTIDTALDFTDYNVGKIGSIYTLNPGSGYDGPVTVTITQQDIVDFAIPDLANGGFWGNNAVISTQAVFGGGLIANARVVSSGYNNNLDRQVQNFALTSNSFHTASVSVQLSATGFEEGYFIGSGGFLDSNKYLTDDYYYQEFSYEVLSSRSLDKYASILKHIAHPVGNELFGKPLIKAQLTSRTVVTEEITQVPS